jgi:Ca2+-binding RTX toxin-like protein
MRRATIAVTIFVVFGMLYPQFGIAVDKKAVELEVLDKKAAELEALVEEAVELEALDEEEVDLEALVEPEALEGEPNDTCFTAWDLGLTADVTIDGSIDNPDVDFFRFRSVPGSPVTVNLEGQSTGQGSLADPYLGVFNSNCVKFDEDDDSGAGLNARLVFTVPSSGSFILAATAYPDSDFIGDGFSSGTYKLIVDVIDPRCDGRMPTILGTLGNDTLTGTNGNDVIHGFNGNDVISGLGGNDIICGGKGRDRIDGGPGNDRIYGLMDNDILKGGTGSDFCDGGQGTDTHAGGCEARLSIP